MERLLPRSRLSPYVFTVAAVATALALSLLLRDIIERTPFLLFWPVVVISGWYGGRWAGVLATALTIVAVTYFLQSSRWPYDLDSSSILATGIFLLVSILVSGFSSARRQAEEEAQQARDWLSVTLSSIGDAVIATDTEGKITFVNPITSALTGWGQQEAVGKPISEVFRIVNEQTRQPVESPVTRVLAEGNIVGLANHTLLIGKDGAERPVDDSGAPIRDHEGKVIGAILVFRDVTERQRAAQKQAELAAIVQSSDDAIISKSLDGIILSWNPGAELIYGYRADEVIGQHISLLVPPDQPDEIPQIMERLKRGEHIDHYETQRITKDGRRLDVSLSISPIRDSAGKIVAAAKIARDMTERKRAEAALRASEARFRVMADTVPGCVWTARPDGSIDYANKYWYDFSGLTEAQTAGLEWASILHPDDQERTLDAWTNAAQTGTPYELEARNRRADGQWRWLLNRAVPMKNDQDHITGWVGTSMDITELKASQEALREGELRLERERRLLQTILDAIPVMIVLYEPDTSIVRLNPEFERLTGWSADEAQGISLMEEIYPDPEYRELVRHAMETLEPGWHDRQMRTRDGRVVESSWANIQLADNTQIGIGIDITARKQAEAALHESEARYKMLFEDSPVALSEQDYSEVKTYLEQLRGQGVEDLSAYLDEHPEEIAVCLSKVRLTDANKADIALYKANSREDLLTTPRQVVPEAAMPMQKVILHAIAEGRTKLDAELLNQTVTGDEIWIALGWSVAAGHENTYDKVLVSMTDITKRKRAEAALYESETRYRMLFEDSPVSLWEQDYSELKAYLEQLQAGGVEDLDAYLDEHPEEIAACISRIRVLGVNKAAVALYGADSKDDLLTRLVQVVPPEALAMQKGFVLAVAEGRPKLNEELFNRTLTDEEKWIALSWSVVAGYEDTYGKVLVSITDITEQKRAEERLRASQQQFRAIFDNALDAILVADDEALYVDANQAACELLGVAKDTVLGMRVADFSDPAIEPEEFERSWAAFLAEGTQRGREYSIYRADGTARIVEYFAKAHFLPHRHVSFLHDITDRKLADERIALLQQVTSSLAATLTVQEVAEVIVKHGFGILRAHIGAISTISSDGQYLDIIGQKGVVADVLERYNRIPLNTPTPMSDAVRDGKAVWIQSLDEYEARYPDVPKELHQKTGTKAVACLPLIVNGRVIGGMGMSFRQIQAFTAVERVFIQSLADQCAQALERARLYQAEQSAREAAEARAARIARLQAVTAALSEAHNAKEIAQVVVYEGLIALKAAIGTVNLLVDDDTFEVLYTTSSRLAADEREGWRRFPADPSLPVTHAVRTRQPLWLESEAERNARYPAVATLSETYPGAWAIVPLLVGEAAIGAVGWTFDHYRTFNEEERAFMMALAQQCAQALERARLIEQEKHRAVLEERQRIARDLHDAVSQTLFAANVMAQSLPRLWERRPQTIPGRLDELARLTQGAASEMRVLLLELRPTVLLESNLPDLLGQLVQIARARSRQLTITFTFEGDHTLPPDVHLTFYRVAQETLNNIIKHSAASQVVVHFASGEGRAELRISDNGKGFNVSDPTSSGFGLAMMRERAQEIGAILHMTSEAEQGTAVTLAWEVERSAEVVE